MRWRTVAGWATAAGLAAGAVTAWAFAVSTAVATAQEVLSLTHDCGVDDGSEGDRIVFSGP